MDDDLSSMDVPNVLLGLGRTERSTDHQCKSSKTKASHFLSSKNFQGRNQREEIILSDFDTSKTFLNLKLPCIPSIKSPFGFVTNIPLAPSHGATPTTVSSHTLDDFDFFDSFAGFQSLLCKHRFELF